MGIGAVSRYKVFKWPGIYPGIVNLLTAAARIRVCHLLQIGLGCRSKSKNRDKLIYFIDRVRQRYFISPAFFNVYCNS
jgi:hypothetical protein